MGLFFFGTKSLISPPSPSPYSHSDVTLHSCILAAFLFMPLFCLFFPLFILFSYLDYYSPVSSYSSSFVLSLSLLFPYLSPLPASSCNKNQRGRGGLWLIQCWSLRSTLKACRTSVKRCGVSSVLWVQHIHTALIGLCQCSWTGRGKIYDGIDHSAKINCPPLARGIRVCKCQHFIHKMKDTS